MTTEETEVELGPFKPEEFVFKTRNDFTVRELDFEINEGYYVQTHYKRNDPYGRQEDGTHIPYYSDEIVSIELVPADEADTFWYEMSDIQGLGHFEEVASWNLGDGHECGLVFKHVESGRHFRKTGYYSSWDGGGWDGDLTEVEVTEVTALKYRDLGAEKHHEYPLHAKV